MIEFFALGWWNRCMAPIEEWATEQGHECISVSHLALACLEDAKFESLLKSIRVETADIGLQLTSYIEASLLRGSSGTKPPYSAQLVQVAEALSARGNPSTIDILREILKTQSFAATAMAPIGTALNIQISPPQTTSGRLRVHVRKSDFMTIVRIKLDGCYAEDSALRSRYNLAVRMADMHLGDTMELDEEQFRFFMGV